MGENETISMDNTKTEIIEHLDALGIEVDEKLAKAELLALLDEPAEEEEAPPPAIVEDDIVTIRGTSVGGTTQMKRSEYDAQFGNNKD